MCRGGKDYHAEENASTYQKCHTGHAWSGHIPESQSQTQPHIKHNPTKSKVRMCVMRKSQAFPFLKLELLCPIC